jgi:hypothetical protein
MKEKQLQVLKKHMLWPFMDQLMRLYLQICSSACECAFAWKLVLLGNQLSLYPGSSAASLWSFTDTIHHFWFSMVIHWINEISPSRPGKLFYDNHLASVAYPRKPWLGAKQSPTFEHEQLLSTIRVDVRGNCPAFFKGEDCQGNVGRAKKSASTTVEWAYDGAQLGVVQFHLIEDELQIVVRCGYILPVAFNVQWQCRTQWV